jgi:hypothetical protein
MYVFISSSARYAELAECRGTSKPHPCHQRRETYQPQKHRGTEKSFAKAASNRGVAARAGRNASVRPDEDRSGRHLRREAANIAIIERAADNAVDFLAAERLDEKIIGAALQGFGPKFFVAARGADDHLAGLMQF